MRLPVVALASVMLGACGLGIAGVDTVTEPVVEPAESGGPDGAPFVTTPGAEGGVDAGGDATTRDAGALDAAPRDARADVDAPADAAPDATVDAGGLPDAGVDAALPDAGDGCTWLLNEDFTTAPTAPDWATAGGTLPGWRAQNGGEVGLIAANEGARARALWYTRPLTFTGRLSATVEFVIEDANPDGAGISVVWGAAADFRAGGQAMGLGICGAGIVGVAAQYRYEDGRIDSVSSTDGNCGTGGSSTAKSAGVVNFLELELTGASSVTARFDGTSDGALTGSFGKTGYVGVTASTDSTRQSGTVIRSLRVKSCPP